MRKKIMGFFMVVILFVMSLTGCGTGTSTPDDYATNEGYDTTAVAEADTGENTSKGIKKEDIKVGVLYLSDPSEGSGYSSIHMIWEYWVCRAIWD